MTINALTTTASDDVLRAAFPIHSAFCCIAASYVHEGRPDLAAAEVADFYEEWCDLFIPGRDFSDLFADPKGYIGYTEALIVMAANATTRDGVANPPAAMAFLVARAEAVGLSDYLLFHRAPLH